MQGLVDNETGLRITTSKLTYQGRSLGVEYTRCSMYFHTYASTVKITLPKLPGEHIASSPIKPKNPM